MFSQSVTALLVVIADCVSCLRMRCVTAVADEDDVIKGVLS